MLINGANSTFWSLDCYTIPTQSNKHWLSLEHSLWVCEIWILLPWWRAMPFTLVVFHYVPSTTEAWCISSTVGRWLSLSTAAGNVFIPSCEVFNSLSSVLHQSYGNWTLVLVLHDFSLPLPFATSHLLSSSSFQSSKNKRLISVKLLWLNTGSHLLYIYFSLHLFLSVTFEICLTC